LSGSGSTTAAAWGSRDDERSSAGGRSGGRRATRQGGPAVATLLAPVLGAGREQWSPTACVCVFRHSLTHSPDDRRTDTSQTPGSPAAAAALSEADLVRFRRMRRYLGHAGIAWCIAGAGGDEKRRTGRRLTK